MKICYWVPLALMATPALAANNYLTTYVSNTGTDTNNTSCQVANPCASIQNALSNTTAGGAVVVIGETDWFSTSIGISKAVTIRGSGVTIDALNVYINAGASDRIVLQNIHVKGSNNNGQGILGAAVIVKQAGEVLIENSQIGDMNGIDGVEGSTYPAVDINATSSVRVTLNNDTIFNSYGGIVVEGAPGSGHLKLFNSLVLGNHAYGVRVVGAGNDALLSGDKILGSTKALDLQSGGKATSYGDNVITNGDAPVKMPLS